MFITKREVGPLAANCYIIADENTKEAAVIDPGGDGERIAALCKQQGFTLRYIINTHGHADHILGNAALKAATGAELLVHAADEARLTSPELSLTAFVGLQAELPGYTKLKNYPYPWTYSGRDQHCRGEGPVYRGYFI